MHQPQFGAPWRSRALATLAFLLQRLEDLRSPLHGVHNDERETSGSVLSPRELRDLDRCERPFSRTFTSKRLDDIPEPTLAFSIRDALHSSLECRDQRRVVDRLEPARLQRGTHPPCPRRAQRPLWAIGVLRPKSRELRARRETDVLELDLIAHPEHVVVQKAEFHWPGAPPRAIAAVEGPRQEHVLSADQDRRALRIKPPPAGAVSAHQNVEPDQLCCLCPREPVLDRAFGLLHEGPHWQAEHQPCGPGKVGLHHAVVQPRKHGARRLPKPGRNANQPVLAVVRGREASLPRVWQVTGHLLEPRLE